LLCAMDYENAVEFWSTTWLAMTETICNNDFHRMCNAIQARETAQLATSEETREKTKAKRQSRALSRLRKKTTKQSTSAIQQQDEDDAIEHFEDGDRLTILDENDIAQRLADRLGVSSDEEDEDDDDDDDDVSDIVH